MKVFHPVKLVRRMILSSTVILGLAATGPALAIDSLKFLVPAGPGGGWDQTARELQASLQSSNIVQKISVDNVTGAGGTIGLAKFVTTYKGDPNALMMGGMVMVGAIATQKSPVNLSQVTPLARLTGEYEVIVVPANSKLQSMKDLIAQLKAKPGAVSWGGGSSGGTDHILTGMIAQASGVDPSKINYIAYSGGGAALASILGGHVTAGVSGYSEFEGQIKAGKLRALAVSSPQRIPGIDVPTLKEQGVNVELINWRALFAAPGISDAQRKELLSVVERAVKSPAWQETLKNKSWTDMYLSGEQFKSFLDVDQSRIEGIVAGLGLTK